MRDTQFLTRSRPQQRRVTFVETDGVFRSELMDQFRRLAEERGAHFRPLDPDDPLADLFTSDLIDETVVHWELAPATRGQLPDILAALEAEPERSLVMLLPEGESRVPLEIRRRGTHLTQGDPAHTIDDFVQAVWRWRVPHAEGGGLELRDSDRGGLQGIARQVGDRAELAKVLDYLLTVATASERGTYRIQPPRWLEASRRLDLGRRRSARALNLVADFLAARDPSELLRRRRELLEWMGERLHGEHQHPAALWTMLSGQTHRLVREVCGGGDRRYANVRTSRLHLWNLALARRQAELMGDSPLHRYAEILDRLAI